MCLYRPDGTWTKPRGFCSSEEMCVRGWCAWGARRWVWRGCGWGQVGWGWWRGVLGLQVVVVVVCVGV